MRQISQVTGCGLERIGYLAFDLLGGACTVIGNKHIMLCFDVQNDEGRVCRMGQSPTGTFIRTKDSKHHHYMTNIASNEGQS